jgi:L-lysine 6-transaminase
MFMAFDLADGAVREQALAAMVAAGVLGLPSGERSIRFRPPVSLTRQEADDGLERLEKALRTLF